LLFHRDESQKEAVVHKTLGKVRAEDSGLCIHRMSDWNHSELNLEKC